MSNDVLSKLRYPSVTASEAKNQFGQLLETALRDGAVVITKHDMPKAILMSIEELEAITVRGRLDTLAREFDARYARMQQPGFDKALGNAFGASPRQLGAAAVKAARKR
ncbi:MAG TPA: type II toxin-antitoxin system Phd/YefM family antitoxin [Kofleriaceae bacterium]|jgi:prevent-host-death family protein